MEEMNKVLIGYPAAGYLVIAVATEYNEFRMTYHKGFLTIYARDEFESMEELLEKMEELAAFSDWKDLVTE